MADEDLYACDYCGATYDAAERGYLRPIGFTQLTEDGPRLPLVKTWCGNCEPDDECDAEAYLTVLSSIHQRADQRARDNEPCPTCGGDRLRTDFTDSGRCHAPRTDALTTEETKPWLS